MKLNGYTVVDVTPWEAASGGKAISCAPQRMHRHDLITRAAPGWFDHSRSQYFDQNNGAAHYRVSINGQPVDEWVADDHVPTRNSMAHRPPDESFTVWHYGLEMRFGSTEYPMAEKQPRSTTSRLRAIEMSVYS